MNMNENELLDIVEKITLDLSDILGVEMLDANCLAFDIKKSYESFEHVKSAVNRGELTLFLELDAFITPKTIEKVYEAINS